MSQRPGDRNQHSEQQQQALRTVEHYETLVARSGSEEVEQIGFFPLDLRPEVMNAVRPASRSSFRASDTTQGSRSGGSSTATSASQSAGSPQTMQFHSPNGGTTYPRLSAVAAALRLPPYPLLPDDILTEEERSASRALAPLSAEEATEGAIQYRMKSIQRTKEGGYYQRFAARVAREDGVRRPTDPQTPVPQTKCSRKQWDQVFLAWRQALKSMADAGQT